MRLRSLRLLSFRAHAETEVAFAPGLNLIYGPNGAGKTNLLEAAHYLCLSKSFLTSQDAHALRRGCPYFEVEGHFEGERRAELRARLVYVPEEGKRIFVNRAPLERLADVVGMLPVVVMAPDDQALTAGAPEERRRFLDNVLSQSRPVYLDDLLKYRRALRQRNALLYALRRSGADPGTLDAWTEELVALGARIIERRRRFVGEFAGFLAEAYARMEAVGEEPSITYQTAVELEEGMDEAAIAEALRATFRRLARRERERGRTLAGPHRDELVFRLAGFEVRPFASQGQHRTFALALKLAQFLYLRERLGETPLLLLDDVFGDLDPRRTAVFLRLLQSDAVGQSLVTAARREPFDEVVDFGAPEHRALHVVNGSVAAPAAQDAG